MAGGVSLGGARKVGSKNRVPRTAAQLQVLRERLAHARAVKASKPRAARKAKAPTQAKRGRPSKKVVEIYSQVC